MSLCLAVVWPAGADAQSADSLRFAETGTIQLTDEPVTLHLFNDGTVIVEGLDIRATLGIDLAVPVDVDAGAGFVSLADNPELSIEPGGALRLRVTRPEGADPGTPGRLLARGTMGGETALARLALTAGGPAGAPAVRAWTVASTQPWLWPIGGGSLGHPIPLTPASTCAGVGNPGAVLVNGDRTLRLETRCDGAGLQLIAPKYPSPGSYGGQLAAGAEAVTLQVRRTMSWWWPVLAICVGLLIALWSQGQLARGWNIAQQRWLARLPKRAADADEAFRDRSNGEPWHKYKTATGIAARATELQERREDLTRGPAKVFYVLPWPERFKAQERKEIRDGILKLDWLVRVWPTLPDLFSTAHEQFQAAEHLMATWAPDLTARVEDLFEPNDPTPGSPELASRVAEVQTLPGAIQIVQRLQELHEYLEALEGAGRAPEHWLDRKVLQRARQAQREAAALLAPLSDARVVLAGVGPVVERGRTLARRLPAPVAPEDPTADRVMTATSRGERVLSLSVGRVIGRIAEGLRSHRFHVMGLTAVFVTFVVTLWGGLAALYLGRAWGTWLDFAAAAVWGFGVATVLAPVVGWVQQLGARPQDAVSGEG